MKIGYNKSMATISISLPSQQRQDLDRFVTQFGFANRSEFFRSLLRFVTRQPHILQQAIDYPFVSPKIRSRKEIARQLRQAKHPQGLVDDILEGLENSDYFE